MALGITWLVLVSSKIFAVSSAILIVMARFLTRDATRKQNLASFANMLSTIGAGALALSILVFWSFKLGWTTYFLVFGNFLIWKVLTLIFNKKWGVDKKKVFVDEGIPFAILLLNTLVWVLFMLK